MRKSDQPTPIYDASHLPRSKMPFKNCDIVRSCIFWLLSFVFWSSFSSKFLQTTDQIFFKVSPDGFVVSPITINHILFQFVSVYYPQCQIWGRFCAVNQATSSSTDITWRKSSGDTLNLLDSTLNSSSPKIVSFINIISFPFFLFI